MMALEQPLPAGFGPYPFSIRATDTDDQDRLHLFALFSYMQESAYRSFDAHDHGQAHFDANGYCWLLTRISVELDRLPRWGEVLTVDTWHQGARRLIFVRCFRFFDEAGSLLGTASSEWLIARQGTHRPLRPDHVWPQGSIGDRIGETVPVECLKLEPCRPLPDKPILVKYADFSDIDRNHHVNNTRYVAWCIDAVHASIHRGGAARPGEDLLVRRFDINYINEIRIGTKVNLYSQQEHPLEHLPDSQQDSQPDGNAAWPVGAQRAKDGNAAWPVGAQRAEDGRAAWHVEAQRAEDGVPVFQARIALQAQI